MLSKVKILRLFVVALPLLALSSCAGWQERLERQNQRNHELEMARAKNPQNSAPQTSTGTATGSGTFTLYPDNGDPTQQSSAFVTRRLNDDYFTITIDGESLSGYLPTLTGVVSGVVFTLHVQHNSNTSANGTLTASQNGQVYTARWDLR